MRYGISEDLQASSSLMSEATISLAIMATLSDAVLEAVRWFVELMLAAVWWCSAVVFVCIVQGCEEALESFDSAKSTTNDEHGRSDTGAG
jgi:hypothetical protein